MNDIMHNEIIAFACNQKIVYDASVCHAHQLVTSTYIFCICVFVLLCMYSFFIMINILEMLS